MCVCMHYPDIPMYLQVLSKQVHIEIQGLILLTVPQELSVQFLTAQEIFETWG